MRWSAEPRFVEQRERDDGRLAGAGGRHDDRTPVIGECPTKRIERVDDGQVGEVPDGRPRSAERG